MLYADRRLAALGDRLRVRVYGEGDTRQERLDVLSGSSHLLAVALVLPALARIHDLDLDDDQLVLPLLRGIGVGRHVGPDLLLGEHLLDPGSERLQTSAAGKVIPAHQEFVAATDSDQIRYRGCFCVCGQAVDLLPLIGA